METSSILSEPVSCHEFLLAMSALLPFCLIRPKCRVRIYNVIFTVSISGAAGVERQSRIKMPSAPDRTTAVEDRAHVLTSSSSSQQVVVVVKQQLI